MAKKEKKQVVVTPAGTAAYAWVEKPDSGVNQFSDDKYKVTLLIPKETDITALQAICDAAGEARFPDVDPADIASPIKDGDESSKEEFNGFWTITMKSKFKPKCVDAKKKPLPESVKIFSGDLIKVAAAVNPYETTDTIVEVVKGKKVKKTVKAYGVSLALNAIQLLEKRNGGGDGASYFDEEDGFEAEDDDVPEKGGDSEDHEDF